MVTIRRVYVALVCAISLQAVTWAAIELLRNLLLSRETSSTLALAFQIAVVLIGLPVFLIHWLWAQRLAARETDERAALVRRLYLYGIQAAFLGPLIYHAYELFDRLLTMALSRSPNLTIDGDPPSIAIARTALGLVVLGLFWLYHRHIAAGDERAVPLGSAAATIRRLYILAFSGAGAWLVASALADLLRWLAYRLDGSRPIVGDSSDLAPFLAGALVGLPCWLIGWNTAQRLFHSGDAEERESSLRKLYLYLVVFVVALTTVTSAAMVIAGVLRGLLGLDPAGDIRDVLPTGVAAALMWAYHSHILRQDAALAGEAARQAVVRRIYYYLVAGVGLMATLVGLGGDISTLIRTLTGESFGDTLREQLAWFTSALIAGLPVWILPWRRVQIAASDPGEAGMDERRSVVRRIYLYFYVFVATMTILAGLVYIAYRLISVLLGEPAGNLASDLGHAIAFTLVAAGVLGLHGTTMRADGRLGQQEQARRLAAIRVALVDPGDGAFGRALLDGLSRALPGLTLDLVTLPAPAEAGQPDKPPDYSARLASANLIVGPWTMIRAGGAPPELTQAILDSSARRLLAPVWVAGWEWAGVERWNAAAIVQQTIHAIRQIVEDGEVRPARQLNGCAIIAIAIGALIILGVLVNLVQVLLSFQG